MAEPKFKSIAFYWAGRKAAEAQTIDIEFTFNREGLPTQDGYIAWSQGLAKMKITVGDVVPIAGSFTSKAIPKMLAQENVEVSFILGGEHYKQTMAVLSSSYKSEYEKGITTGQTVLEGSAPKA